MRKKGYVAVIAGLVAAAALVATLVASASEPESPSLSSGEVLALEPLDPEAAAEAGWPATYEEIEARAISWYHDERIAAATDSDLARAIAELTKAIRNPPTEKEPDQVMYIYEMALRREAACRSLSPEDALRGEYCSTTSNPDLTAQAVPWASD